MANEKNLEKGKQTQFRSGEVEYDYKGIKVVYYSNHVTDKMKNLKNKG